MASRNLEECQRQAGEVTILMKSNVEKAFEREGKLANLEERTDELKNMASTFQKTAKNVERKTRCEKWRWYIIGGGVSLAILVIIIIIVITMFRGEGGEEGRGEGGGEAASRNP